MVREKRGWNEKGEGRRDRSVQILLLQVRKKGMLFFLTKTYSAVFIFDVSWSEFHRIV